MNLEEFDSRTTASEAAADWLSSCLNAQLCKEDSATMLVSGGTTPLECFQRLSLKTLDWSRVYVSLTDERCVPVTHEASNERIVREFLLQHEARHATFIPVNEQSLAATSRPLACSLVGMGEDGHFASIFPDSENLLHLTDVNRQDVCETVETRASEHPRVTVTLSFLMCSSAILLLVFGTAKRRLLDRPEGYPIEHLLRQQRAPVDVYWAP